MKLPTTFFPLLWFIAAAVLLWALWGLDTVHACEHFDDIEDDTVTTDEIDWIVHEEEFEAAKQQAQQQVELVDYRITQQQNKIDSLERNEAELRNQIEQLQEEAATRAAEDEVRRIALGEALKNYGKEHDT